MGHCSLISGSVAAVERAEAARGGGGGAGGAGVGSMGCRHSWQLAGSGKHSLA